MLRYKRVLQTYLEEVKKENVDWKAASEMAWNGIDLSRLPSDFLKFWNDPKARKAARAYKPKK